MTFESVFWILPAAFGLYWARALITKKGWRGAMLGAVIRDTVSEQELENSVMMTRTTVRVHVLEPGDGPSAPSVGVELSRRAALSWSMSGFSLTREEALALSEHLSVAAKGARIALREGQVEQGPPTDRPRVSAPSSAE